MSRTDRTPLGVNIFTLLLAATGIVAGATLIGAIVNPKQAALYVLGPIAAFFDNV